MTPPLHGHVLAVTVDGRWQPGIGDPTMMGWITVAAYMVASVLCWSVGRAAGRGPSTSARVGGGQVLVWYILTAFTLALGINKQLDLQSLLTVWGRQMAQSQGWYGQHRIVQWWFIISMVGTVLAGLVALAWLSRGSRWPGRLALVGAVFLTGFVLIRATSFHHVDQMLGLRLAGWRLNWLLELGGISCIGLSAGWQRWWCGRVVGCGDPSLHQ